MQRPESFGTRAELNDKEYAEKVARDERARKNALSAVGSFRNDNGWVTKSFRQTSLIINPPNGRVPPLVAGAEKRRTPRAPTATARSTRLKTSPPTTAASRSASSAR